MLKQYINYLARVLPAIPPSMLAPATAPPTIPADNPNPIVTGNVTATPIPVPSIVGNILNDLPDAASNSLFDFSVAKDILWVMFSIFSRSSFCIVISVERSFCNWHNS